MKRYVKYGVLALVLGSVVVVLCNVWVVTSTSDRVYSNISEVPYRKVGLVLGTSSKFEDGRPNIFFNQRIATAIKLFKSGKVSFLIVSGDNSTKYYNEPLMMKNALIKGGIPESKITMDFAGLRTLDSIVRSNEIFGQDSITVITQDFHSYRALFIADYYKLNMIAMVPGKLPLKTSGKVRFREFLARPLAILDLFLLNKKPKHLGKKELLEGE
ncbi:MAG: YdcF family protein [Cyclobacteriaceae bacterium]|nr:YdcF family protein [Cyclobacteriaceae bacterium]